MSKLESRLKKGLVLLIAGTILAGGLNSCSLRENCDYQVKPSIRYDLPKSYKSIQEDNLCGSINDKRK